MKFRLLLSVLLLVTGMAAFSQAKQNDVAVAEKGLTKVSIMYPYA